jgi:hypothetical protein
MPSQKGGLQPEQENRTKAPRSGIEQVDLFIRSLGGSIRPIRDSEANRFWADIYEGRLRLEDIDLDAIPVPGR